MKKSLDLIITALIIPLLFLSIKPLGFLVSYPWLTYVLMVFFLAILIAINLPDARNRRQFRYNIESLPPAVSLLSRETEIDSLYSYSSKKDSTKIILVEGESGIGKTALVSSFLSKIIKMNKFDSMTLFSFIYKITQKNRFDSIIWQPLSDIPTMREVVNGWLNMYDVVIPELAFDSRIDAFFKCAKQHKQKRLLIVFDNAESLLNVTNNTITLTHEFSHLISRLINARNIDVKIIITTAISLKDQFSDAKIIELKKLNVETLQQIITGRTDQKTSLNVVSAACGNPSAALLLAGIIEENQHFSDHFERNSLSSLVERRIHLLSDAEKRLVLLLSVVRFPFTTVEIQNLWAVLPPYTALNAKVIEKLRKVYVLDCFQKDKYLINPIVSDIMIDAIAREMSAALAGISITPDAIIRSVPLDYSKWSEKARSNTKKRIFTQSIKMLFENYALSKETINVANVINNISTTSSTLEFDYLASNTVAMLLHIGRDLSNITFPSMQLIGVDFSRTHIFNSNFSNVKMSECIFADRNGSAYAVCFMDDDHVIVGLASGSVELRFTRDLHRVARIEAHSEPVRAVYYSHEYKIILSAGEDGRIVFYNESLEILRVIKVHERWIWRLYPINRQYLITVACDSFMAVIDLSINSIVYKISVPSQRIWDAAILKGYLYLVSEEGVIWKQSVRRIIESDIDNWEIVFSVSDPIKACCVCQEYFYFGCRDGSLYSLKSTGEKRLISKENGCIRDLCSINNCSRIVTVGDSGIAHIYDVERFCCIGEIMVQTARTWQIDIRNGQSVTVGDDRTVHLWDISELTTLRISSGNGQSLRCVDSYLDQFVFACADDFLRISSSNMILPWLTISPRKRILGVVSLIESRWACSFDDGYIALGHKERIIFFRPEHKGSIESIARNSNGSRFATGGEDRIIKIFDTDGILMPSPQPLHSSRIWALCFSPDGKKLASAGGDFIVAIWRVIDGKLIANCVGHNNLVLSLCWVDDNRIASAGTDGTLRLWEANSGIPLLIKPIEGLVRGITVDTCGNVFAVGRSAESNPGWIIIKWKLSDNSTNIYSLPIKGGSARSIIYTNHKIMVGGDMPYWIEINPDTLEVESQIRIPGIYSGTCFNVSKINGVDPDNLKLLGANVDSE